MFKERELNHSIEAEQAVLGALLIDPEALDKVSEILRAGDFYDQGHAEIFTAMQTISAKSEIADVINVAAFLERNEQLASICDKNKSGLSYIVSLSDAVPSSANVKRYAEIVREKARERELLEILEECYRLNTEDRDLPLSQRIDAIQSAVMALTESNSREEESVTSVTDVMKELCDDMLKKWESGSQFFGLKTGLPKLDESLQGMKEGSLILIAARPGQGKTSLAMQLASNVALDNKKVLVFEMEMPRLELAKRLASDLGSLPLPVLMNPQEMHEKHWDKFSAAIGRINGKNLHIVEKSSLTINGLRSIARKMAKKLNGLDMIVVDYIGLMQYDKTNRVEGIADISRGLKLLANELNCVILGLSQLNRESEKRTDKRPILSDLRDSGSLEQDADVVLMINNQPAAGKKDGLAEILIRKNRNGSVGSVPLRWVGHLTRFEHTNEEISEETDSRTSYRETGL